MSMSASEDGTERRPGTRIVLRFPRGSARDTAGRARPMRSRTPYTSEQHDFRAQCGQWLLSLRIPAPRKPTSRTVSAEDMVSRMSSPYVSSVICAQSRDFMRIVSAPEDRKALASPLPERASHAARSRDLLPTNATSAAARRARRVTDRRE